MNKIGINIVIERERQDDKVIFMASSPDINVFAEGENIDEAKKNFLEGVKSHLEVFPEERESLIKNNDEYEMPILQKVFL